MKKWAFSNSLFEMAHFGICTAIRDQVIAVCVKMGHFKRDNKLAILASVYTPWTISVTAVSATLPIIPSAEMTYFKRRTNWAIYALV